MKVVIVFHALPPIWEHFYQKIVIFSCFQCRIYGKLETPLADNNTMINHDLMKKDHDLENDI